MYIIRQMVIYTFIYSSPVNFPTLVLAGVSVGWGACWLGRLLTDRLLSEAPAGWGVCWLAAYCPMRLLAVASFD